MIRKTTVYFTFLFVLSNAGRSVFSQEQVIHTPLEGDIEHVVSTLQAETGFTFSYSPDLIDTKREVKVNPGTLSQILNSLFPEDDFTLSYRKNKIIITPNHSQVPPEFTISGYLRDLETGEALVGATLILSDPVTKDHITGTSTNAYGFYSIRSSAVSVKAEFSYLGYSSQQILLNLAQDTTINISLQSRQQNLQEIIVVENSEEIIDDLLKSSTIGKSHLHIKELQSLPPFMGEVDPIKSVQMLPGVQNQGEGSTNFYVRGGAADQNLILLDEAPVYNPSHLMGFFSVFNQDALRSIDFYKGSFPAKYGGRLSSVMEVHMKEGNIHNWSVSGGLGTAAARLTIEGPLVRDRSSMLISARRTYGDLFLKLSSDEYTRQTSLYFYDLNTKINYKINHRNRIYLSGYFGRDLNKIRSLQYAIDWGNATGTLRWNHIFGKNLFSNLSLVASNYDYLIDIPQSSSPFDWKARIRDLSLKYDFSHYVKPGLRLDFGLQSTHHHIRPGESDLRPEEGVPSAESLEHGLYITADHQLSSQIALNYGIRVSAFQLLGGNPVYRYDDLGQITSTEIYSKGEIYKTYLGIEPRITSRYSLTDQWSLKFGYGRNYQYLNMLSNLSLGFNVFDIWIPSSLHVKPQRSDQLSLGIFHQGQTSNYALSIEGYYKWLERQIDFRDHSSLILNPHLEGELLIGKGRAYGIEFMVRKQRGKLKGWLGYTWSRSFLDINSVNGGKEYPTSYDQPNVVNFSASYRLHRRWSLSANFVYSTGRPITLPVESFWYDGHIVPIYGTKNSQRLPDYHRLDLSANLYRKKVNPKNDSYWTFSFYNVYDRHNAATAFVSAELEDIDLVKNANQSVYHKLYIFGIIPSVTYNFKF